MRLERRYIKEYRSNNSEFGYNIKEGGDHQRYPKEICEKISNSLKGKPNGMLGKRHSDETKRKMSEARKRKVYTKEECDRMSRTAKAYYATHPHPHTFTEEDYRKAKLACLKQVRIVETGQVFNSMTECANYLNVLISNLSRAISENRKYKGFHYEIIQPRKPDGQSQDVASSEAK